MATTLDAYRWALIELDKHESPTFSPGDFVYHFNSTVDEYLSNQLPQSDVVQKRVDNMESFAVLNQALTQHPSDTKLFALPDDYRHVWEVKVTAKWLEDFMHYEKDDVITLYPKRRRSNRKGYQEQNAYQKPSYRYPVYRLQNVSGTRYLRVELGARLQATGCNLDYIRDYGEFSLSSDLSTYDEIPFPTYVIREIIKLMVRKVLENTESPRYRSQLQEMQLRNE